MTKEPNGFGSNRQPLVDQEKDRLQSFCNWTKTEYKKGNRKFANDAEYQLLKFVWDNTRKPAHQKFFFEYSTRLGK